MNARRILPLLGVGLTLYPFGSPAAPQEAADEPAVERLDEHRVRVGMILVDREKRELTVEGVVNSATVLEYLATARAGFKSYESAMELECSAVEFNLALILLGLDEERGVASSEKFDPRPPQGDEVEIQVEWQAAGKTVRRPAEDLIYSDETRQTLARGPWVYTGSITLPDGQYLAQIEGVLIGFMHTPESIIDNPQKLTGAYGSHRLHPEAGPEPGTRVRLIVRRAGEVGDG